MCRLFENTDMRTVYAINTDTDYFHSRTVATFIVIEIIIM